MVDPHSFGIIMLCLGLLAVMNIMGIQPLMAAIRA
jgi:hypothetical protein